MSDADSRTLLLVEDEALVAMVERKTLERYGYSVRVASTGEDAVVAVDRCPEIDLVLMDIDLGGGIDGTEAAEAILSRHNIPLVFLSSHTEPEYVERTERITSYGYIVKNSGDTVLNASIKMAFRLFEAKQRLQESEALQKAIVAYTPLPLVRLDLEWRVTTWNSAAEKVFGWRAEEVIGGPLPIIPEQEREVHQEINRRLASGERVWGQDVVRLTKDGTQLDIRLWLAPVYTPANEVVGILGVLEDISEQKKRRRALAVEKARFESLFQESPMAIAFLDQDERVLECNREFRHMFGYTASEAVGRQIDDLVVPEGEEQDAAKVSREVLWGAEPRYHETRRRRKDGTVLPVAVAGAPLEVEGRRYTYAIYQDIGERVRIERNVELERRRFEHLFHNSPVPQVVLDAQDLVVDCNHEFTRLFGYSCEEAHQRPINELIVPPELRSEASGLSAAALEGEPHESDTVYRETKRLRKDGTLLDVAATGTAVTLAGEQYIYVVFQDISERKRAEERVAQLPAEKERLLSAMNTRHDRDRVEGS